MCLCQRATGNQLLETDLKKKKNKKASQHTAKSFIIIVIASQVPVPAYSLCKEGNGSSGCRLCRWCAETKTKSSNFPLGQVTGISEPKHIPTTKQRWFRPRICFPNRVLLRNDTIYIFPPPRWLLITGYQKLKTNSYSNSTFLLKASLASYIRSSWSIVLLYIVQTQQWWKEVGGAWPQGWLQKHSAFFPCQANMRHSTLLKWVCSLCHLYVQLLWCPSRTVTWGWFKVSVSTCARITRVAGSKTSGCTDSDTS